jgi:hypothetical protein
MPLLAAVEPSLQLRMLLRLAFQAGNEAMLPTAFRIAFYTSALKRILQLANSPSAPAVTSKRQNEYYQSAPLSATVENNECLLKSGPGTVFMRLQL